MNWVSIPNENQKIDTLLKTRCQIQTNAVNLTPLLSGKYLFDFLILYSSFTCIIVPMKNGVFVSQSISM